MNNEMNMGQPSNLLHAYQMDGAIRERCNEKGLYCNFTEQGIAVTLYLNDVIEDSSYYQEFTEICAVLTEEDNIALFIDSPGGYMSGGQMITRALRNTLAYSVAIVVDQAASMASILALSCDDLYMHPYSYLMIHMVSYGSGGKDHEVAAHVEFTSKKAKEYVRDVYKDFLTEQEIEDVIRGGDIYLDDTQVMERWAFLQELKQEAYKEQEQEHLKMHIELMKKQLENLEGQVTVKEEPKVKPKRAKRVAS